MRLVSMRLRGNEYFLYMEQSAASEHERFIVLYRITANDSGTIEQLAQDICVEQTVEIPIDCIPQDIVRENIVGRVESISPSLDESVAEHGAGYDVAISYRCDLTGDAIPQFLNVLFGNISLKNNIRVIDLQLPGTFLGKFSGPSHGIEGIRKILGVYGRPLACTALKPVGLPVDKLAALAAAFARGGVDLIKDDHGLSNQAFHPFKERVARCQEAVARENARSGRVTLYCPMISGRFDEIEEQVHYALRQGVQGMLIAPILVGCDTVRYLSETYRPVVIAHPALTGTFFHTTMHGMTPAVLLGSIFRLIGADVSVFPNAGGRFFFTNHECSDIAESLKKPLGEVRPAFPCPAGGMTLERIKDLAHDFGRDAVLLIGGALLRRPSEVTGAVEKFMDEIRMHFHERIETPDFGMFSSCEWKPSGAPRNIVDVVRGHDFTWTDGGRRVEAYKTGNDVDAREVSRQELTGTFGEKTCFDLRYFEIGPGGYSSLEKHVHEHVIIGARGKGILVKKGRHVSVSVNDIAYVGPLEVHQLRNESSEPFGFYCIVDHMRDKPMRP